MKRIPAHIATIVVMPYVTIALLASAVVSADPPRLPVLPTPPVLAAEEEDDPAAQVPLPACLQNPVQRRDRIHHLNRRQWGPDLRYAESRLNAP